jgi:hypothetical protein
MKSVISESREAADELGAAMYDSFRRVLGAAVVGGGAAVLALAAAFLGGGNGEDGLMMAALVVFFAAGWSVLPLLRASRGLAATICAVWLTLAVLVSFVGDGSVQGWLLKPWLLASFGLALCLALSPPRFMSGRHPKK